MRKIVMWSGGCDSTLILNDLAKNSSYQNPIYTVTILNRQIGGGKDQQKMESLARKEYLIYAKSKKYHIKNIKIKLECLNSQFSNDNQGLIQALIWICGVLPFLENDDELNFGYIRGDDFWHYKEYVINSINQSLKLKGASVKILFPLEWENKLEIITRLKSENIYKYTWYCENPINNKPCKECLKCKNINLVEYQIKKGRK